MIEICSLSGRKVQTNSSVQVDWEPPENHTHMLKGQTGVRRWEVRVSFQMNETQLSLHEGETRTEECQRECSLWGCKYLGLFTVSFTADLFLYSNGLNAFCLFHGNSSRKFDSSRVVTCLQSPVLMISLYSNHIGVINDEGFPLRRPVSLAEPHTFAFSSMCNSCVAVWVQSLWFQMPLLITDGETLLYDLWSHHTSHVSPDFQHSPSNFSPLVSVKITQILNPHLGRSWVPIKYFGAGLVIILGGCFREELRT